MSEPLRIAIVGYGKIAEDQHVPAIAGNAALKLIACVSRRKAAPAGVPAFASIADLRASGLRVDAVALCNTPEDRPATAHEAIAAGWHVFLEKPPAATLGAVAEIEAAAVEAGITLFASWHSRFAPAVAEARARLAGAGIRAFEIEWREDVRKWHPGQAWIWQPGGFGVFDPGINALSIATEILPVHLTIEAASLDVPSNRSQPIAAALRFGGQGVPADAHARFDWGPTDRETWTVRIETDAGRLALIDGGARLLADGVEVPVSGPHEYPALYDRFLGLVRDGRSEVDLRPLRLVADAFLRGERRSVAPFED
ncbi:Gfo/Idh/MocA family oxidoreductase [Sphingomonas sp.]|uniref:Gfo/Idh/MocA family protein n=1 Tax=Sphingomonas sp. TaxID=28214 RepID=UPI000DAF862D|nr:Gfo/Idh/MocA family oxidoreductase [Sphingomonas sp.]PZU07978.1 MAG: galactose 1-dehydrogenase [Sphingomonas sp.]